MAKQIFYSTYARFVIGKWISLVAMIRKFALEKQINIENLEEQLPTLDQIKEAIFNAPDLVRLSFDLIATFQQTQIIINQKYDLINQQIILITDLLTKALKKSNIPPPIPVPELEKHLTALHTQKNILDNLTKKIEELTPNLDDLVKKYNTEWEKIQNLHADLAIEKLEGVLNIKFSDLEKAELYKPTKNKSELMDALKKYNLESFVQKT